RTSTDARRLDERTAPWDVGSGNNFTVRKEIYLRIGGCDTRLGRGSPGKGGVDMDLFYRLLRAGASARYGHSITVFHEQKSDAERMQRRPMYGYGMGACFALWAREGDVRPGLALQWIGWRFLRMVRALLGARLRTAREEYRMVLWTFPGLIYGLRAPG